MHKTIKKISKISIIFILVLIIIPVSAYFILQSSRVQTYLVRIITNKISENLDAKFSIESVNYSFFNRVILNNVYIQDQYNDTLLFSEKLTISINGINRDSKEIDINKVDLYHTRFYLYKDSTAAINIKFITDQFKSKDTTKTDNPKWKLDIRNIEMRESIFKYHTNRSRKKTPGVDFNNMVCYIKHLDIRDLGIDNGVVSFLIRRLVFIERSGFDVYSMKAHMSIGDDHMKFRNITIRTANSYIMADSVSFRHNDYDDYKDFNGLIKLDIAFKESNVSLMDIGFFATKLKDIQLNVGLSGYFYGRISSLKGKNVRLQVGKQTELLTDFNFNGLPNIDQTFIFIDFKKLTTFASDFEIINRFNKPNKQISFPSYLNRLGKMSYEGNFTGFVEDFVTYGRFVSALGNASTDISLKPLEGKNLAINGKLKTSGFDLGQLFNSTDNIGKISFNAQINGTIGKNKTIATRTEGIINSIEINNYTYQNVIIDGFLTEKKYDGFLSITDPNIELDFSGGIDFSQQIPVFNFSASVPKANLFGLNIDKKDTTALLSFDVDANFIGNNIDNAIGEINFRKTEYSKSDDTIKFETLQLSSEQFSDTHKITLKSDYLDALLYGTYKSKTLVKSIKGLFYNYLPSLIQSKEDTLRIDYPNNFKVDVHLKNTTMLSKLFLPDIYFADNSNLEFKYGAHESRFFLTASTTELKYKQHTFSDLSIVTFSDDSLFTAITKIRKAVFNNYFILEDLRTTSLTSNDEINVRFDWNNKDTVEYQGKILASAKIRKENPSQKPSFDIVVLPSDIVIKDSLWRMNRALIHIDTTSIKINDFIINHNDQFFKIKGLISENKNDSLFIDFGNLNLAHINVITKDIGLNFNGFINGNASFSNMYESPLFSSNIIVDNLMLNDELIGNTFIVSRWKKEKRAINLSAFTNLADIRNLVVEGEYLPENHNLDFTISLNKFNASILNSFLKSFASNIKGKVSGDVSLKGTFKNPEFNGLLTMEKGALTIDYLKTRYSFSSDVGIKNNSIIFDNISVSDPQKNKALTNGSITFGAKKRIDYNFTIRPNNFLALNTSGKDNEMFYGIAYMTGVITINGGRGIIAIDISGKTEKNTKLNIPISKSDRIEESGFITFVNTENKVNVVQQDNLIYNLSGFRLNFDLQVTQDAETQLIFDSTIGDLIRAKGDGDLKLEIDKNGNFNMFGDYNMEEGDYLFTLGNILNKKFDIERGGRITWNGSPYNAIIDIEAIYNLRAPLTNLFPLDSSDYYRKRIPVECQIFMSQSLKNPDVKFNIELPTSDEETKNRVRTVINTQEKLNKQFLSLLFINNFIYDEPDQTNFGIAEYGAGSATTTTTELLSNQLSHWLSQISDEWDIGINYRPGDEISKDQVDVALSTQLLNDRVLLNGNVGYGGQAEQASNIVGDVNLEVKLNKSGKLRVKAFNKANDKLIYEESPYTQGVGIFYREEFNTFSGLMRRFWNKLTGKKEDEITPK
ncbi:MAG: hypothetical protein A2W99_06785 [Bacteroidetes bacterium GWF2_33_16]|nr:MAG: hypothetical protein A2X00_06910 [Bacteroidetes bacterium GWE2_32_14]OFY02761.1 MAG: hypothetical protein A2W99_06785 [Bacteroidetes bacterium GWF2_33_16]